MLVERAATVTLTAAPSPLSQKTAIASSSCSFILWPDAALHVLVPAAQSPLAWQTFCISREHSLRLRTSSAPRPPTSTASIYLIVLLLSPSSTHSAQMAPPSDLVPSALHPNGQSVASDPAVKQEAETDASFIFRMYLFLAALAQTLWARVTGSESRLILAPMSPISAPSYSRCKPEELLKLPAETLGTICAACLEGDGPIFVQSGTWQAANILPGIASLVQAAPSLQEIVKKEELRFVPHAFSNMSALYNYYSDSRIVRSERARHVEVMEFDNPQGPSWATIWAMIEDASPTSLTVGAPTDPTYKRGRDMWYQREENQRALILSTAPLSMLKAKASDEYKLRYLSNVHMSVVNWHTHIYHNKEESVRVLEMAGRVPRCLDNRFEQGRAQRLSKETSAAD
ncbi:hypothetical protein BU16DRAFT_532460 [Lophium mytilinum]|uniref:Uncharacterized protein n=1 Tax=Lophium mytilinum TaxID=390894 RepID=A0A6A6RB66_9PEZI|nr:hypothetical protein BU16DRAFT_532460 [Lophium mytilinum]